VLYRLTMVTVMLAAALMPSTSHAQTDSRPGLDTVDLPAVSYGTRPGATKLLFNGTSLMAEATGLATVEKQRNGIKIAAQFTNLKSPTSFGHEYLTYVVWALTPDGRAFNIGELVLPEDKNAWTAQSAGNRSAVTITTPHQTFAMAVTAEPYFAVKAPSRVVVLTNGFAAGTEPLQKIDATFDFARAGGYEPTGFSFDAVLLRTNLPLDFFQARNALRIAQSAGAEAHAAAVYANAMTQMGRADDLAGQKKVDKRGLSVAAREAVQTAEDARAIAEKTAETRRQEDARRAAIAREAEERARAQAELERRLKEEAQRTAAAEAQRVAAEAERLAAERRREEADHASQQALAAAQEAQRQRAAAEELRTAALRAQKDAEERQAAALAQQKAAEAEAARNRAAAAELDQRLQQALRDREDLRASLLQQLSVILETRDTARGLVVNLSDVTFATGQATLEPGAREKLARVSGILAAHPALRLEIEGHTDSVGSDTLNQALSQRRADAVRGYLIQQGVPAAATSAAGFGKSRPVASNDSAEGRQLNRRVELVVSGDAIGTAAAP
jgi:outer membrane protein OmpA-like peptidoglycan-associated protein